MAAGDLTTLESVKLYLGITTGTADAKLQSLISSVSAWILSYIDRPILSASYTEVLDGTGTRKIMVANYPVTAFGPILVDGIDVTANAICDGRRVLTLVDRSSSTGNYSLYTPRFRRDFGNVSVTYTAGYAVIPADIEGAACRIVAWGYTESTRIQQNSKSMGGEVVSFSSASAPKWATELLDHIKRVV